MPDDPTPRADGKTREFLAITVTLASLLAVTILAVATIRTTGAQSDTAKQVLATVLPLIGAWVGTVLAFYFSKQNFEAAARSVADLAKQVTPQQKLQAATVLEKMIPRDKMFFKTMPIDQTKISDLLQELDKTNKGDRVPVLSDKNTARYIMHRSILDRYLASKAQSPSQTVGALSISDLFKERPDWEKLFATSFSTVRTDGTLADAKAAMEQTKNCEDVFVTADGTSNGEVVGWVTDNIIQENLRP